MDAPPIIQWDSPDQRNPFSWYVYMRGSPAMQWGLKAGLVDVTGICNIPSMWNHESKHQGTGVLFVLDGAKDSNYKGVGNALFPEILKSDLREIRSTIEAYSKSAELSGYEEASACGLLFNDRSNVAVQVVTDLGCATYNIDRWD